MSVWLYLLDPLQRRYAGHKAATCFSGTALAYIHYRTARRSPEFGP